MIQPLGRGTAHDRALEERARGMLALLGIEPADAEPTARGLVVGQVHEGAAADKVGLRAGDRITRVGGVRVHTIRDLAPQPSALRVELEVYRPEEHRTANVTLAIEGASDRAQPFALERFSALWGAVLASVFAWRPLRSRLRKLLLMPSGARKLATERIGLWGGRLPLERSRRGFDVTVALPPIALSSAGVLLVCLEPADFFALRSISLYLGFAALSAALMLMNGRGSSAARARSALEMLGRMAVLGVLIACACALCGTKALDGIVAEQGGSPWQWAVFRKPALTIAFPLYLAFASELGAATLPLPGSGPRVPATLWARLLEGAIIAERVLTNVALASLGVVIFAGGWQVPFELGHAGPVPRLLGALLFVGKAWACAALLAFARNFRWAQRLRVRVTALGCGMTVVLTAVWLSLEPARAAPVELFTARVLSVAALLLACAHTAGVLRTRIQRRGMAQPAASSALGSKT